MSIVLWVLAAVLLLPVVAVRLIFLVPGRLGWINYLANVFSEMFVKKVGWSRVAVELAMAALGLALLRLTGVGGAWVLLGGIVLLGLELYVRSVERRLASTGYTPLDAIGLHRARNGYPSPSTQPELTINLVGPFVERMPEYRLGTLVVGREFQLRLIIGNHTLAATQTVIRVRVTTPTALACKQGSGESVPRLGSGEVHELQQEWRVMAAAAAGTIGFEIEWGYSTRRLEVRFDGCVAGEGLRAVAARINRYPGACRSAFAWRGDMDLYDESTLQSIEGLETAFGLGARYRMPQTMYLSSRLSLDQAAAEAWAAHYGVDRGAGRIPRFIEWMQENVELRHVCAYPFHSRKRFVIELGNHGHLHFGTDTSGTPENGWKARAKMGTGVYPWLGEDRSSLAEQRDNALEAKRLFEKFFNFTPKSWAMPNRTNDDHTAAAMEAAGCEVLCDSNARTQHNVLLQPPPHHPHGTSAVELTKRYPGDPEHVFHVAMNLFWIHRAHRRGIPVVFMCHQHLRQFDGYLCTRLTEYTLRYALSRFRGDLHVNTVYGIGKYWREVLSPQTARVQVMVEGPAVRVKNPGDFHLVDAPVDVDLSNGGRMTLLVDLPAGEERRFALVTEDGP